GERSERRAVALLTRVDDRVAARRRNRGRGRRGGGRDRRAGGRVLGRRRAGRARGRHRAGRTGGWEHRRGGGGGRRRGRHLGNGGRRRRRTREALGSRHADDLVLVAVLRLPGRRDAGQIDLQGSRLLLSLLRLHGDGNDRRETALRSTEARRWRDAD